MSEKPDKTHKSLRILSQSHFTIFYILQFYVRIQAPLFSNFYHANFKYHFW